MSELIEINNVSKRYLSGDGTIDALHRFSLNIRKGEFIAITGKSGSGKSTLMNILGCLDFADEGSYCLDGIDVRSLNDSRLSEIRNEKIGFIFQGFNLIPCLNAIENVELPLSYRGVSKRERRTLAKQALSAVGLKQRMTHTPSQMSGGQQQRVAIARAVAANPQIMLADEPTGNLDTASGNEILDILTALNETGKTVIIITHDPGIARMAKRRISISNGVLTRDDGSRDS